VAPNSFLKRTHTCGELRAADVGHQVVLNGWVDSHRDHGHLLFVDLRDRYGITQVVLDPTGRPELKSAIRELKPEFAVAIEGSVRPRPEDAINRDRRTGEIEVAVERLQILNPAKTPPFEISGDAPVTDEVRLRYRYLDIRKPAMQANLARRARVYHAIRSVLIGLDFVEVETPVLTRSTPEGARDYLVPARVSKGNFYALPQSPQLFKQLLMVGGIDRYYQIVKCFRDEDLRADRQPEFTQLDMEMSFVDEDDVFAVMEAVVVEACVAAGKPAPATPFSRMSYSDAMTRFGSDKPDLRFAMEIFDLSDVVAGCSFKVFSDVVARGDRVCGIRAPACAGYSRKQISGLEGFAKEYGAKGLAWIKVTDEGYTSPIAKFLSEEELDGIRRAAGAEPGDLILMVADSSRTVLRSLGELRRLLGQRLDLARSELAFCWITQFPMFEPDEKTGELVASHHPFTSPLEDYEGQLEKDPATLRSSAYDLVVDGIELGSGSVRIHDSTLQTRVFEALKITAVQAREKFGFLLDAFEYGAPPHAGFAVGLDRLVMILAGADNIRDVIAFPKTTSASCIMTGAPSKIPHELLDELGVELAKKANKGKET